MTKMATDAYSNDNLVPKESLEIRKTRALAQLRQSIWEVSQFTTLNMIESYVQSVLREIESDEP